jgi:hypothetical protein
MARCRKIGCRIQRRINLKARRREEKSTLEKNIVFGQFEDGTFSEYATDNVPSHQRRINLRTLGTMARGGHPFRRSFRHCHVTHVKYILTYTLPGLPLRIHWPCNLF